MRIFTDFPIPKNELQFLVPLYKLYYTEIDALIPSFQVPVYVLNESEFIKTASTQTVFTWNLANRFVLREFFNRLILFNNIENTVDIDKAALQYKYIQMFIDYSDRKADAWGRIISARALDFSPVANYDKYLDGVLKYEGAESNATEYGGSEKNTQTETGKETDTTNYGAKTETDTSQNTTYDSTSYNDISKNTNSIAAHIDSNERTFENRKTENVRSFTDRIDESTKSFVNRKDINTLHEYGNIGVATTIKILQEYTDFYKTDLTREILTDFMDEISIY